MEECEALCSRIGIMVEGRLCCLGSAQHLKSKFGLGFQLELGLQLPTGPEISELSGQTDLPDQLSYDQVIQAFAQLGCNEGEWASKLTEKGSASILSQKLRINGTISLLDLLSFYIIESRVLAAETFVFSNFQGAVIRERQSGKVRFEFPPQELSLGKIFGLLEDERRTLKIADYSLSQTTLEQVFNYFANQQIMEEGNDLISPNNTLTNAAFEMV
mmetsp:Transcript_31274/g.40105  ORF Transcript_31274/g.40105 Transcript_31274/m.40105 type:complete len:216 (-) Transcript_31274:288-935(-)